MFFFKLVLVLCMVSLRNANLIIIYDQLHFYEIEILEKENVGNSLNFFQSFGNKIYSGDKCAPLNNASTDKIHADFDQFELNAETFIYSNYEKTLSFIIQITFKFINKINNYYVRGFELIFHSPFNNQSECLQIIADYHDTVKIEKIKLKIKDPSFLSQNENFYLFYFGTVSIKPLVDCDINTRLLRGNKKLCSLPTFNSVSKPLGIRSRTEILNETLKADTCLGHILKETCIIRYPKLITAESSNVFVMHPLPNDFLATIGDLDITASETDQPSNLVESSAHEKFPNGIIIKLILDYTGDEINYVSKFSKANIVNSCNRTQFSPLGCFCAGKCQDCYMEKKRKIIEYIPLIYDKYSKSVAKSKACQEQKFYHNYDFDGIHIENMFQTESLSIQRHKPFELNNALQNNERFYNRDFLPRICMSSNNENNAYSFDINIFFNDYHKVGESSILNSTKYKLRMFSYEFSGPSNMLSVFSDDLIQIKPKLVLDEAKLLKPTDMIQIKNLVQSKYILELIPIQQNSYCSKFNKCIDESTRNNQIQCIACSKLMAIFVLENDFKNIPIKHFSLFVRNLETKIRKQTSQFDVQFTCSRDEAYFERLLLNSYNHNPINARLMRNMSEHLKFITDSTHGRLLTALVPADLNLENVYLPYIKVSPVLNFFTPSDLFKIENFIILIPIFVTLMIVFALGLYLYFKGKQELFQSDYKKKVVFYISIYVDYQTQLEIRKIIEKYALVLMEYFKQMNIKIVDFKTNSILRKELIESSDLIVYICGTENEICKLKEPMKIGQNEFHDDYNRIHLYEKFQKKCLNLTFNKNIYLHEFYESIDSANSVQLKKSSESSSLFSNVFTYGNDFYLKLPDQNEELIGYLLDDDKFNKLNDTSDSIIDCRSLASQINKLPFRIIIYNLNKILTSLVEKELKKNKNLSNLDKNICYNGQPCDEEFVYDEIYDEFESLNRIQSDCNEKTNLLNECLDYKEKTF